MANRLCLLTYLHHVVSRNHIITMKKHGLVLISGDGLRVQFGMGVANSGRRAP